MNIIQANRKDKSRIIEILCLSFENDPQTNYVLGSGSNQLKKRKRLMAYAFEFSFANGKVEMSEDKKAAAIWKKSGSKKMTMYLLYESILFFFSFGWKGLKRISDMEKKISTFYPTEGIFRYLWILGTDPNVQGKGYGSAILSKAISSFQADSIPLYLETSTELNLNYYERKGFKLYHRIDLGNETDLTIYLMRFE